mmetsp:Transcript_29487/g.46488  ORF Transcript_29487/g.46488 Transcript_29487/m.46488 type:complete len:309 (-) Transcript_29487:364-1290(-)|eukprot:CAMPEP_0206383000 /NCGR_PEP_ID=MMETSP0294-20121207/13644_1 /ASSEMBLY_ACC=CAM_ASM_000327 /TAXON_ID=39354 /ORGANISM="Heterosigma akashiwo, Strain CCMP2393" /LENGTH=308 /DNA_ID=CAMNT_0053832887 /DNA_START=552 /DNA_END=1478 /DNA_ORIENTATION=-
MPVLFLSFWYCIGNSLEAVLLQILPDDSSHLLQWPCLRSKDNTRTQPAGAVLLDDEPAQGGEPLLLGHDLVVVAQALRDELLWGNINMGRFHPSPLPLEALADEVVVLRHGGAGEDGLPLPGTHPGGLEAAGLHLLRLLRGEEGGAQVLRQQVAQGPPGRRRQQARVHLVHDDQAYGPVAQAPPAHQRRQRPRVADHHLRRRGRRPRPLALVLGALEEGHDVHAAEPGGAARGRRQPLGHRGHLHAKLSGWHYNDRLHCGLAWVYRGKNGDEETQCLPAPSLCMDDSIAAFHDYVKCSSLDKRRSHVA